MSVTETIDTADLSLLDDSARHARCTICTNEPGDLIGVPFVALCGRRAINLRRWSDAQCVPPDACTECVEAFGKPCRTCGARN